MEAGADDYLVKPVDGVELKARLLAGRRIVDLHEQLLLAGEFLRFAATHDPLTGLWNRGEILTFLRRDLRPLGAVQAYSKINTTGQWVDRSEHVNLNELFDRMTTEQMERYAKDGTLPPWFEAIVGRTSDRGQES